MSSRNAAQRAIVFDGSNHEDYGRFVVLERQQSLELVQHGSFVLAIMMATTVGYMIYGDQNTLTLSLLLTVTSSVSIVLAFVYAGYRNPPGPVLITTSGRLCVRRKDWSLDDVGEVELSGHSVLIKGLSGSKLIEVSDRQIGDMERFARVVRGVNPRIIIRAPDRGTPSHKVRVSSMQPPLSR